MGRRGEKNLLGEIFIALMSTLDQWLKFQTALLVFRWLERALVFSVTCGTDSCDLKISLRLLTLNASVDVQTKTYVVSKQKLIIEEDSLTASMLLLILNSMEVYRLSWRYSVGFHTTKAQ